MNDTAWIKYNVGQTGFYRVRYPDRMWVRFADAMDKNPNVRYVEYCITTFASGYILGVTWIKIQCIYLCYKCESFSLLIDISYYFIYLYCFSIIEANNYKPFNNFKFKININIFWNGLQTLQTKLLIFPLFLHLNYLDFITRCFLMLISLV